MWAPVLQIGAVEVLVILVVFGFSAAVVFVAAVIGRSALFGENEESVPENGSDHPYSDERAPDATDAREVQEREHDDQ
ncbi:hypothetical protein [Haloarchaeobius sp. DFWS5]|uniref:hypothetical protein n=1 Tax=Haloarchaeobius sp. DFWS5 TaxID=3446114 RepID=UPI003EBB80D0